MMPHGAAKKEGLLLKGGVVVDNDAVGGQCGNVTDGIAIDVHLDKVLAVCKRRDIGQFVVVHGYIGEVGHTTQHINAGYAVVRTLDNAQRTGLTPLWQCIDIVVGEVNDFKVIQGSQCGDIRNLVVGKTQFLQLEAAPQDGDVRQRVVVQRQRGKQLQIAKYR